MTLIGLLILCVVVGMALYLLRLVPMDDTIKLVVRVIVIGILIIVAILFLAQLAGLSTGMAPLRLR